MRTQALGRLEMVDLRSYWEREATEFTPWLAQAENIKLLGDAIGLELEVVQQEANVGPFRADILCREVNSGAHILIENQLEATDHTHLGQLITYASGLETVYIVWIAKRFFDEHRSALDWLNSITNDSAHFFGVEIELWRINDSPPAPKFNLVSKPNEWVKTVRKNTTSAVGPGADMIAIWEAYWIDFERWVQENKPQFEYSGGGRGPLAWRKIGVANAQVYAGLVLRDKRVVVGITLVGPAHAARLQALEARSQSLERTIGCPLEFKTNVGGKKSSCTSSFAVDLNDRGRWTETHRWLVDTLAAFSEVMGTALAEIDTAGISA